MVVDANQSINDVFKGDRDCRKRAPFIAFLNHLNPIGMTEELLAPFERANQIGRAALETSLRGVIAEGVLSHGWIISGGKGAGKATLAYRLARALMAPEALADTNSLTVDMNHKSVRLISQAAHPDLFVAERTWNEKTSRYQTEITVETIRKLTLFLNHTPALGAYRVAIIDTADDLNKNAANALLKILEEPPAKTALFLLAEAPGRLIATIRSRCRRLELRPLPQEKVMQLLEEEGLATGDNARRIADHSGWTARSCIAPCGAGDGGKAIIMAQEFLALARSAMAM